MQETSCKGCLRLCHSGFESTLVSDSRPAPEGFSLNFMKQEDIFDRQEVGLKGHFASFRKVPSCCFMIFRPEVDTLDLRARRIGSMMSRLPSVVTSSSVSLSMSRSARMGFSMTMPRLLPIAESFFFKDGHRPLLCPVYTKSN